MGNKYSSRARDTSFIAPPIQSDNVLRGIIPPVQAPAHPPVVREEDIVRAVLKRLRTVRDSGEFRQEGCHSFREWTQKKFGEKIGIFVDEIL